MNITVKRGTAQLAAIVPVDMQLHLSEQLDGGSASYYKTEPKTQGVNTPLDKYSIAIDTLTADYVGIDKRAFVKWANKTTGTAIYKHTVELTEPTKLLQGVLIDGFAVTQPDPPTKTLLQVLQRILASTPFDNPIYSVDMITKEATALSLTISPQFRWNTQSTLFEVLKDIGAVIGALPRLVADDNGDFTLIRYEFINDSETSVTDWIDGATAFGESVSEEDYNSALSAVVENLQEE